MVPSVGMDIGEYCTWGFCNLKIRGCAFGPLEASALGGKTSSSQWLKWFCEAGGSPDEARLEQTPYPF